MTKKIFNSIFLTSIVVLLVSLSIAVGCSYYYFASLQEKRLQSELSLAAQGVERGGIAYLENLPAGDVRLTLVAADGSVLFDTEADAAQMDNHAQREEIRQAFAHGSGASSRYSATLTEQSFYRAALLADGSVLRVSFSQASVLALFAGIAPWLLLAALLAAIFSRMLAKYLARRIIAPLNGMNLDHPLENEAYEELAPLLGKIHRQQEQLRAQFDEQLNAERARREFSANVSHELKTPLTSIIAGADMIENKLVRPEDLPRFSAHIKKEAARLLKMIEDIIRLAQLDEGVPLHMEPVDLGAIAGEVLAELRDTAARQDVSLEAEVSSCVMQGVHQLLHEIMHNLVENAIKYNRPGGSVKIFVARTAEGAELRVSDTGIGIPREQQERVFERFYRVDKSRSQKIGGTGLGLSIVKHAAAYFHADIALASELGEGTEISVKFPAPRA